MAYRAREKTTVAKSPTVATSFLHKQLDIVCQRLQFAPLPNLWYKMKKQIYGRNSYVLNLAQWKEVRRVDHITIPVLKLHPRYRDLGAQSLKGFDTLVQDYANAPNKIVKLMILGDIIAMADTYVTNNPTAPARYTNAVTTLVTSATQDLRDVINADPTAVIQDLIRVVNAQPIAHRWVNINVFYLDRVGANPNLVLIDAIIDQHIVNANTSAAFVQADIAIRRNNANATLITETADNQSILCTAPVDKVGKFHEQGASLFHLWKVSNASGGAGIDVVYLEEYVSDDCQGFTMRAGADYGSAKPTRPIVTVRRTNAPGGAVTFPTTLLHEMCHALGVEGHCDSYPDNLLAGGAYRNGNNHLTLGQMILYRNNPGVT
jgi:hypothetical protein